MERGGGESVGGKAGGRGQTRAGRTVPWLLPLLPAPTQLRRGARPQYSYWSGGFHRAPTNTRRHPLLASLGLEYTPHPNAPRPTSPLAWAPRPLPHPSLTSSRRSRAWAGRAWRLRGRSASPGLSAPSSAAPGSAARRSPPCPAAGGGGGEVEVMCPSPQASPLTPHLPPTSVNYTYPIILYAAVLYALQTPHAYAHNPYKPPTNSPAHPHNPT